MRGGRRASLDAVVVPILLLFVAWDLLVRDPSRALAWRLLHDPRLESLSAAAPWLFPATGALDRDPIALLLGGIACLLALSYLGAALGGAGARWRGSLLAVAALLLVLLPTAVFVAVGFVAERPFGQDGGVVQIPLALDKILAGESPYGADYSRSVLGRQSRVSEFWAPLGGNPILRHHAYLPGTHALMLPFYLGCRALLGAFDARFVTSLAFAIAVLLAARLASSPEERLVAAALVAVNPLVYWHQVFGANDVLFVALVLGSVLLARGERALAAGAVLGFACATKQLAWPFAPFLLAQLSGARNLRDLLGRDALRRMAGPAAAALLVFAIVVIPLAARDASRFYGDIVAYNVGLPGGDNYPLGGTPGFGFANFVLYFGRVASLKDAFPFTIFYVLLVPFGVLLLREQLREGSAPFALVTGSIALLSSLYFSRVVHANYLVAAAILLPLGVLATRRRADLCAVPLLLFWLGAVVVERGAFRLVWDQAAAAGLARRTSGLASWLAPRSRPELTLDPVGLAFGALAAGLGLLYAAFAVLGARPSWRTRLLGALAVAVVAVPCLLVVAIGEGTGLRRTQDPWAIQAPADAARLAGGQSPHLRPSSAPVAREAWSESFRLDPPRLIAADGPLVPPGTALLGLPLRLSGVDDGRLLSLIAVGLAGWLLGALSGERLGVALLLAPPFAFMVAFGSGVPVALSLLLAASFLARRGRSLPAGLLAGAACACSHEVVLAAPFLVLPGLSRGRAPRTLIGLLAGYAVLVLPVAALSPAAYLERAFAPAAFGPGAGLANLLYWRGLEESTAVHALFALLPLGVGLAWILALLRMRGHGGACETVAGGFALLGVVVSRAASPASLALPMTLIALGGLLAANGDRDGTAAG